MSKEKKGFNIEIHRTPEDEMKSAHFVDLKGYIFESKKHPKRSKRKEEDRKIIRDELKGG